MVSSRSMERKHLAQFLLIAALAFVFSWFGLDKLQNPILWTGFFPLWMDGFMNVGNDVWIIVVGLIEILFAILIIIPIRRIRQLGTILIILHLIAVLWQVGWNDTGVRDIGILISGVALLTLL